MNRRSVAIQNSPIATSTVGEFPAWPHISEDEIEAVSRVLRSGKINYWTGEEGRSFEREFADFVGSRYAIAVSNGTVALELALRALAIGYRDDVITSSRAFIASASCITAVGARPVFADVDRDSQTLTVESVRAAITPRTKAVIVVHLAGWPCEMDAILELTNSLGIHCVEDCAQAHGATYRGRPVGSFGDIGCFSFCHDKNLTTGGEGGMVTTNSESLSEFLWSFKDDGKNRQHAHAPRSTPFRFIRDRFGTNARLTEIQSAIGRSQLRKLPAWLSIRRAHAARLAGRLSVIPALRIPMPPSHIGHACYRFYAFVRPDALAPGWSRDRILQTIAAEGVPCSVGSCSEIYMEKAVPPKWRPESRLPISRELGDTSMAFLVHPTLTEAHIDRACKTIVDVMLRASRE